MVAARIDPMHMAMPVSMAGTPPEGVVGHGLRRPVAPGAGELPHRPRHEALGVGHGVSGPARPVAIGLGRHPAPGVAVQEAGAQGTPRLSTAVSDGTMLATHTPATGSSPATWARARNGPCRQAARRVVLEAVGGGRQETVGDPRPRQHGAGRVGGDRLHGGGADVDADGDRT